MYTRGAATNGLDISYIIHICSYLAKKNVVIRGELVIARDTFQKNIQLNTKNPRKHGKWGDSFFKKREVEKWNDIDFVAYEVIKPSLKTE